MSTFLPQDAKWDKGIVTKDGIPDEAYPVDEIASSKAGTRQGRLYFTDGTSPNYAETGKPSHLPGWFLSACMHKVPFNVQLPGS